MILVSFFQILHIFEELYLGVYAAKPKDNEKSYLIKSATLIALNYLVLYLLFMDYKIGYYIAFYTVLISIGVVIVRILSLLKHREKSGYGLLSSIPMGLSGIYLFYLLVSYFMPSF